MSSWEWLSGKLEKVAGLYDVNLLLRTPQIKEIKKN